MFLHLIAGFIIVIASLAVITNVTLIALMIPSWKNLVFSDMLVLNLFVANMFLGCGYTLPVLRYFSGSSLAVSVFPCKITGFIVYFLAIVTITTLQILSIHQYILIKKPMLGHKINKIKDLGIRLSLLTWLYAIILPIMPLLGWSDYTSIVAGFTCELDYHTRTISNKSYILFAAIIGYVIPSLQILYCSYHCIYSKQITNGRQARNKQQLKFMTSICLMGISFIIMWSPYGVITILNISNLPVDTAIHILCIVFAKASSVTVSLLYYIAYRRSNKLYALCSNFKSAFGKKRPTKEIRILMGDNQFLTEIPQTIAMESIGVNTMIAHIQETRV